MLSVRPGLCVAAVVQLLTVPLEMPLPRLPPAPQPLHLRPQARLRGGYGCDEGYYCGCGYDDDYGDEGHYHVHRRNHYHHYHQFRCNHNHG